MFAEKKPRNGMTCPPGSRNGRSCSGSCRRSAAHTRGPLPNERTVADVMNVTSFCQPGNGRKKIRPTTNANTRLTQGTPRWLVRSSPSGALRLRAVAYEIRAVAVV